MHGQPFITHEGTKPDKTIIGLTDGSRVAMPGHHLDYIEDCINRGQAVTIEHLHQTMMITVNPDHIIAAVYTENGGE